MAAITTLRCALAAMLLGFATHVVAVPPAGTASIVAGTVAAVSATGERRLLQKGDAVYSGERVLTAENSYVRIGFIDGSSMVLRPETEFAIVAFRFQPGAVAPVQVVPPKPTVVDPSSAALPQLQVAEQNAIGNQAFFRLVRGGFRAVSGLVGKINREEYAVATPVATIGIRGTVFWSVSCDAVCAADPLVQGALPAGEAAVGGTISSVDQGSVVVVSNTGGTTVIDPAQFVLTTASGKHALLTAIPGFLASENWLAAQQAALAAPSAPATTPLSAYNLSTVPTVGALAAAALITVIVVATDQETAEGTTTTTATTGTTSTTSTR